MLVADSEARFETLEGLNWSTSEQRAELRKTTVGLRLSSIPANDNNEDGINEQGAVPVQIWNRPARPPRAGGLLRDGGEGQGGDGMMMSRYQGILT